MKNLISASLHRTILADFRTDSFTRRANSESLSYREVNETNTQKDHSTLFEGFTDVSSAFNLFVEEAIRVGSKTFSAEKTFDGVDYSCELEFSDGRTIELRLFCPELASDLETKSLAKLLDNLFEIASQHCNKFQHDISVSSKRADE